MPRKLLGGFLIILLLVYYVLTIAASPSALDEPSRGLSLALNVAFGQDPYFPEKAKYAYLLPSPIEQCGIKNVNNPQYCMLSGFIGEKAYFWHCGWKLRLCADLSVDETILTFPHVNNAINRILSQPCAFLPSREEIKRVMDGKSDRAPNEYLKVANQVEMAEYLHARDFYQCDLKTNRTMPLIWTSYGQRHVPNGEVHHGTVQFGN